MAWEPDIRPNFFFSPPAHLCAVTSITEISLNVTLSNQYTLTRTPNERKEEGSPPPPPLGPLVILSVVCTLLWVGRGLFSLLIDPSSHAPLPVHKAFPKSLGTAYRIGDNGPHVTFQFEFSPHQFRLNYSAVNL